MIYKEKLFMFGKIKTHIYETYTAKCGCICLVL